MYRNIAILFGMAPLLQPPHPPRTPTQTKLNWLLPSGSLGQHPVVIFINLRSWVCRVSALTFWPLRDHFSPAEFREHILSGRWANAVVDVYPDARLSLTNGWQVTDARVGGDVRVTRASLQGSILCRHTSDHNKSKSGRPRHEADEDVGTHCEHTHQCTSLSACTM